ncbi:MAG: hypothetical protein PF495_02440 [Spirochaetales bacterium]|jgi:hypothetical protein|nr:hypothetical protein [Spirochaetales bacterium]
MHQRATIIRLIICLTFITSPAWAADYSTISTPDLAKQRNAMRDAPEQERQQFRTEWQKRMQEMPVEDRYQYREQSKSRMQDGTGQRSNTAKDGSGKKKNRGSGNGQSRGKGGGGGHGGSR